MVTFMIPEKSAFETLHPESDFRAAMAAAGLDFPGDIIPDGQLHRIKVNGDRGPNSWYVLHLDRLPAGSFGCWKRGFTETWCAKTGDVLTEDERAERDRLWAKQREERDADRRRTNDEARAQAQKLLDIAKPATDSHPYLKRKSVKAHPGVLVGPWPQRQRENCLLIPLRTASGQLATVQAILPDKPSDGRDKDFLKGGSTKGAYFALGDLAAAPVIAIAEGYATAATIHEVTGHCAVMAVDAGNLKPVAEAVRALYPGTRIIVAADNDRHTEGNPGLKKATAAAKAIKADLAIPEFTEGEVGTDFNDLAQRRGADAVRHAIEQAGKPAKAERPEATADRPVTIRCIPGELPEMVDKAEAALCKHEANFYQRSGQLVRWCLSRAETVHGITRPGGAVIILNLDADYLLDRLNRRINWERWNEERGEFVACNAPRNVASTLLARRGLWNAQPLVAAVNAPTLRPDGSILDRPGYDAATGLLFVNSDVEFAPIPQQPTREHAAEALAFLYKEVLSGFPFAAPHDRSAALSAILTACVRHALKAAPMHTFAAPVMASGKSLLADVSALIATGHPATVMSYTPDGDEMRKRVLSVLMQGDLVVNLDNVEEPLASQTLCSVLTQETFTDRILGVNKTGTAPTLCCWLATGNNLVVAGDMTTRIVPCRLDPQVERPEEREFQRNLYDWIPANRPHLIRAVLTILRGYVVAGRPKQPIKNFARFEDWSRLIRSALVWLGEADPLLGREQLEDGDPVRAKLRALLLAWFAVFKTAPATSKEAVMRANETRRDEEGTEQPCCPAMREALDEHFTDRKGAVSSRYLGEFLKKYAGRVEIGAKFEHAGSYGSRVLWQIAIQDKARFGKFCGKGEQTALTAQTAKAPPPQSAADPDECLQSVQSMQSVSPSPEISPEKISVPPPVDPPTPARNAPPPNHRTYAGESGELGESVHPSPEISPEKISVPPPVDPPTPARNAPLPATASADAGELWDVLKHFRGWETTARLASKLGWPQSRLTTAAQELQEFGRAEVKSGGWIRPVGETQP